MRAHEAAAMSIAVLGAGAWGTAMAAHAARRHSTLLWARDTAQVEAMSHTRQNARYLPGLPLPETLRFTSDLSTALEHAAGENGLVVLATPLAGLRSLCQQILANGRLPSRLIWLCKGFEEGTGAFPHQVVAEVFGKRVPVCGVLSGPSFAQEVAEGQPCALTVAATDAALCACVQQAFHHHAMRIYASDDLIGVETGGAVKNILAIATGASDGLGLGLNARAALVTRGLAEMMRLGVALGGRAETFMGLTGMGDLMLTATGGLSRNRAVGLQLAKGQTLPQILSALGHVAEGVRCARAVRDLAHQTGVDMPITEAVCAALFEGMPLMEAVTALLGRDAKSE